MSHPIELITRSDGSIRKGSGLNGALLSVLAGVISATLATPGMAFPTTWTFIETSCTNLNSGLPCATEPLPMAIAQLNLQDLDSSGAWSRINLGYPGDGPYLDTGDHSDFSFSFLGVEGPPFPQGSPADAYYSWDISFTSSAAGLDLFADFEGETTDFEFGSRFGPGYIATDADVLGCDFSQCSLDGFWELTAVPEPSSLSIIGTIGALFSLGLWCRRARLKTG